MDTIIAAFPYLMAGLKVTLYIFFLLDYPRVFDWIGNGLDAPYAYQTLKLDCEDFRGYHTGDTIYCPVILHLLRFERA